MQQQINSQEKKAILRERLNQIYSQLEAMEKTISLNLAQQEKIDGNES